jgi:hypothetical protein
MSTTFLLLGEMGTSRLLPQDAFRANRALGEAGFDHKHCMSYVKPATSKL